MGKFRTKLKGQSKGKRWPKGQSSSSNPQTKTHRDQAKSRFFQANVGTSNLTTTALQKHNAVEAYTLPKTAPVVEERMDEAESCYTSVSSFHTMKTFASEWSDCSNMSFKRFMNVFRSDSALHKEMLAILAAITEVVKQNGGSETPTEFYCALITSMEQICEEKNEDQITAVLSLISMGIKTVPVPVLRSTYSTLTNQLLVILGQYGGAENNVIIKSIMTILGVLLKNQEMIVWQDSQTLAVFAAILNPFCIHSKPKWRKAAQQAVISILSADIFANEQHYSPPAEKVAEFCKTSLESCLGSNTNSTILISSIQAGQTTILHILGLLKDVIIYFNKSDVKNCCEIMLRVMSLNYPIVTSCAMQVLHALFSSQKAVAPAKLNGQIIAALYDYQPSATDSQPILAWLAVMQQAHVHLADVDLGHCCGALPIIFNTINQLWLSQKPEVVMAATHSLEVLLRDAVSQVCADENAVKVHEAKLSKCVQSIELGYGYQYHHAWPQILHVTAILFEVCGAACPHLLVNVLKTLSELRDSYKFSYNNELERTVGAAIRAMGPEVVLNVITLRKDSGELNLDRSWLLPVLRENVQRSTLEYWARGILPLAIFSQKRSVELANRNDGIGAHSAELLHLQLWNLLPSFCNQATDIHLGFKSVAKVLGMAISERKELRLSVMASLRKLIAGAHASENKDDVQELARFGKNYLPILFNLYTAKPVGTDEEGQRLAAMDTIKVYLEIARPELTASLFDNAMDRLKSLDGTEREDAFIKESIMDLIKALIPYQTADNIDRIYEMSLKHLAEIKNQKEQKKAYRLLEVICSNEAQGCKEFLQRQRKFIQKILKKALTTSAISSKGARLRCLNHLLKAQPQLDHESTFIRSTIHEAILGCKDPNQRCRLISYEVLNTIGEILSNHDQMEQFVALLLAELKGTPQQISCTLLGLSSILHTFTGALGKSNIVNILENVFNLITTPTREVVASCLSFIKVFIKSMPSPQVAVQLPSIVKGLCAMKEDCQRHCRVSVRNILSRLMRKFGSDSITAHVPVTDKIMYNRLRNLRKEQSRNKRKKEQEDADEDEVDVDMTDEFTAKARAKTVEEILADSDSDFEDHEVESKSNKKQRKYQAFIEEDPESIVDFKDPSVVSKITTSLPAHSHNMPQLQPEKGKKNRGFKTTADGRLIIADLSDSDSDHGGDAKISLDNDSDSGEDTLSKAETEILRDRKRKRSNASSAASSFQSKYKPGGSGIHRKVQATAGSVRSVGTFGTDYKAKKAAGDMKKKGKVDPYAYVPLQRSALNRRKKSKSAGAFKNIIGAAKSGSKKGTKARKRLGK